MTNVSGPVMGEICDLEDHIHTAGFALTIKNGKFYLKEMYACGVTGKHWSIIEKEVDPWIDLAAGYAIKLSPKDLERKGGFCGGLPKPREGKQELLSDQRDRAVAVIRLLVNWFVTYGEEKAGG